MSSHLTWIGQLRGLAALLVVLLHGLVVLLHGLNFLNARGHHLEGHIWHFIDQVGDVGVDVFFIISGFVMALACQNKKPLEFIWGRFWRVVPLYWIYTALVALTFAVFGGGIPWLKLGTSLLFIPDVEGGDRYLPLLGPGWTLCFELLFYSTWAFALMGSKSFRFKPPLISIMLLLTLVLLGFLGYLLGYTNLLVRFYLNPILLEFCMGILIFHLYKSGYLLNIPYKKYFGVFLSAVAVGILLAFESSKNGQLSPLRWLDMGIAAATFFIGYLLCSPQSRVLEWLGEISFSLYLLHLAFGFQLFDKLNVAFFHLTDELCFFAMITFVLLLSWLAYWVLERPLVHISKQPVGRLNAARFSFWPKRISL